MKIKKILLVLIAIVTIFGTFAINTFAIVINGQLYESKANVPFVSNTVFQNFTNDVGQTKLLYNASSSYLPFTSGATFIGGANYSISNSAGVRTSYLPDANVGYYGFDSNFFNDGIMFNRVYTAHGIDSLCQAGKPVVASAGFNGLPKYTGVSIIGGAMDSANANMQTEIYKTFFGGYRVTMGVTDLVSGTQTFVTRVFDSSSSSTPTSYHYLNPLLVDALEASTIDDNLYILVLDYVRVEANKWSSITGTSSYNFFGFDICYTWDLSYAQLTNGHGTVYSGQSIYLPFYMAAENVEQLKYNEGYLDGYNDGFEAVGVFDFIINGVEGFLTAEIFPGFSFGLLLMAVAGIGLFIWILKIFAGG